MRVAVVSGKGGTGKTTVATALAKAAAEEGLLAAYVDCDVEAPNGHLLLRPTMGKRQRVSRSVPVVDLNECVRCGACMHACQFGAIVYLGDAFKVFANLCKSCGACVAACNFGAISEVPHAVGWVETGQAGSLRFAQGVLDIGEPRAVPLIESAQATIAGVQDLVVLDAPPGTSCPVVTVLREADAVLLVAEPTPFGMADLQAVAQTVKTMGVPVLVVINRCDLGDRRVHEFCESQGLTIAAEIPYSQEIAASYVSSDLNGIVSQLRATLMTLLGRLRNMQTRRAS